MLFSAPAENGNRDASGPNPDGGGAEPSLQPVDLNGRGADEPVLSVIIPTRNEENNVEPLLDRLAGAFEAGRAEIIFVDDSDDRTPEMIAVGAKLCPLRVRLVQRPPAARKGGLSSVVAQEETSTRLLPSKPSADDPLPAYLVPMTRSQS